MKIKWNENENKPSLIFTILILVVLEANLTT